MTQIVSSKDIWRVGYDLLLINKYYQLPTFKALDIRAVYTRENKSWLIRADAYISLEKNHLHEYG